MGILYQTPAGSPLQFKVITTSLIEQKNFSSRDWRIIMKGALQAAGDYWIAGYLPLRFQNYARAMGIYHSAKPRGLPLVKTGNLRETVGHTARAEVKINAQLLNLVIPTGNIPNAQGTKGFKYMAYKSNPVVEATLSAITDTELERMGKICEAVITEAIESASVRTIAGGKVYATGFAADHADGTESTKKVRYWTGKTREARTIATLSASTRKNLQQIHTARSPMTLAGLQHARIKLGKVA